MKKVINLPTDTIVLYANAAKAKIVASYMPRKKLTSVLL